MKRNAWKAARGSAGFTLVELVVVIAILGILAGVGTVGYSGYIQRANEAADEQLQSNTRYAAALGSMQNQEVTGAITIDNTGTTVIGGRNPNTGENEADKTAIEGWLEDAFGDTWRDNKLKVGGSTATIRIPVLALALSPEEQEAIKEYIDSNYYGNEDSLANTVQDLTGLLEDWQRENPNGLKDYFADGEWEEFLAEYEIEEGVPDFDKKVANAMLLYLSDKAGSMDANTLFTQLADPETGVVKPGALETIVDQNGQLPTYALMYAVVTGYANSSYATDEFKTLYENNPPEDLSAVEDLMTQMATTPGSEEYVKNEAQQDMSGYLGALEVINNYKDKIDITLDDAYMNNNTLALLQGILNAAK